MVTMPHLRPEQLDPSLLTASEHANLDHTDIPGIGSVLELVESKLVTADTQTVTLSGLDLDTDGVYLLQGHLIGQAGSANDTPTIRANGSTTQQTGTAWRQSSGSNTGAGWSTSNGMTAGMFFNGATGDEAIFSAFIIGRRSENGVSRLRFSTVSCTHRANGTLYQAQGGGVWTESAANLTSLVVAGNFATSIGNGSRFNLYRLKNMGGSTPTATPTVLTTAQNVDLTAVGTTNIYTVPTGKSLIVLDCVVKPTTATSVTGAPSCGVGVAVGEDDIYPSQPLTGLDATTKRFAFSASGSAYVPQASEIVKFGVDTGATATALLADVSLIGYLIG